MTGSAEAQSDGPTLYRRFAFVLAAASVASALISDSGSPIRNAIAIASVVPFVVWAFRFATPTLFVVVTTCAAVLITTTDGELETSMFTLSVAATIVGGYESSLAAFLTGGAMLTAVPAVGAALGSDTGAGIWTMGVVLPLVLSRVSLRELELARQLAVTRAVLADQRVLEERRRIARDVHDSVGHGLAAMLLHITGARHVLRRDLDAADEALSEAETVGRRSMDELRQTLGLLRTEPSAVPRAPVPDIVDLVRRDPDGIWSRFRIVGDVTRIDPFVGTSLHRVAEEAFANVRRHTPRARTDAVLEVRQHDVVMTIESVGKPVPRANDHDHDRRPRYGIVGMSERMAAVGGVLDAGPTPSGWVVTASVPLHDGESAATES
jgi:signal transduction histidine kinase